MRNSTGRCLHAMASRGKKGGALASFIQGIPEQQHGGGLPSNCASLRNYRTKHRHCPPKKGGKRRENIIVESIVIG